MNETNLKKSLLRSRWCGCKAEVSRTRSTCNSISVSQPIKKPDIAIYSQEEQFAVGRLPTWDNPDITTNNLAPLQLRPSADVRVRNISEVNAANVLVHCYLSPYGVNTPRRLYASKQINVLAAQSVEVSFPFDRATLEGDPRVGVHILIDHPYDPNIINNRGSQIIDGGQTSIISRTYETILPIANSSPYSREFTISALPTELEVNISPDRRIFPPHDYFPAKVVVKVPDFITGTSSDPVEKSATLVVRDVSGELIGGATIVLIVDN